MPPKGKKNEPSKKSQEKVKEKIIEDKTFGIKNKKGNKQQKFIKTVTQQVKQGNQKASKTELQLREEREKKKDEKKKLQEELNTLFKPVQQVGKGADPKSVLCAFFKQGQCSKGDKCKFSHDLTIERKAEKRSVYDDGQIGGDADTMDNWDEETLNEVINKKHAEADKSKLKTAIICKFFLEAVENSKYGWFWNCPNGIKCIYRHALPPGFVLKKDQKKEDKGESISLEDLIERERAGLGHNVTKINLETFLAWKDRKRKERIASLKAEQEKKKADFKAGKMLGISGRQMFEFNPELVGADDDEGEDGSVYVHPTEDSEEEEDAGPVREILGDFVLGQVDNTGTQASLERWKAYEEACKLDEAAGISEAGLPPTQALSDTDAAIAMAVSATINGEGAAADMPIDEALFDGDDIDLVEEDLETLDLDD